MLQQAKKMARDLRQGIIQIINLSASGQNRSSKNRDASNYRLFFPPLVFGYVPVQLRVHTAEQMGTGRKGNCSLKLTNVNVT